MHSSLLMSVLGIMGKCRVVCRGSLWFSQRRFGLTACELSFISCKSCQCADALQSSARHHEQTLTRRFVRLCRWSLTVLWSAGSNTTRRLPRFTSGGTRGRCGVWTSAVRRTRLSSPAGWCTRSTCSAVTRTRVRWSGIISHDLCVWGRVWSVWFGFCRTGACPPPPRPPQNGPSAEELEQRRRYEHHHLHH